MARFIDQESNFPQYPRSGNDINRLLIKFLKLIAEALEIDFTPTGMFRQETVITLTDSSCDNESIGSVCELPSSAVCENLTAEDLVIHIFILGEKSKYYTNAIVSFQTPSRFYVLPRTSDTSRNLQFRGYFIGTSTENHFLYSGKNKKLERAHKGKDKNFYLGNIKLNKAQEQKILELNRKYNIKCKENENISCRLIQVNYIDQPTDFQHYGKFLVLNKKRKATKRLLGHVFGQDIEVPNKMLKSRSISPAENLNPLLKFKQK